MIKVHVHDPEQGISLPFEVQVVPRIGETVVLREEPYRVYSVFHTLPDRRTQGSIIIYIQTE